MELSLVGRVVICKHVLLSTLWFSYHSVGGALTRSLVKLEVQSAITYGVGKSNSPALELAGKNVA